MVNKKGITMKPIKTARAFKLALLKNEITVDYINKMPANIQAQLVRKDKLLFNSIVNPTFDFFNSLFVKLKYRKWVPYEMSEDMQMSLVKIKPDWLRFISNKAQSVVDFCLEADVNMIRYVKNPTEDQIRHAYKNGVNFGSISAVLPEDIQNDVMDKVIRQHTGGSASYWTARTISYIKKPVASVQLKSVKAFPDSIKYITRPTDEVQLFIAEHYPNLVSHIKNPKKKLIDKVFEMGEYSPTFAKRMLKATARKDVKTYIKFKNQV